MWKTCLKISNFTNLNREKEIRNPKHSRKNFFFKRDKILVHLYQEIKEISKTSYKKCKTRWPHSTSHKRIHIQHTILHPWVNVNTTGKKGSGDGGWDILKILSQRRWVSRPDKSIIELPETLCEGDPVFHWFTISRLTTYNVIWTHICTYYLLSGLCGEFIMSGEKNRTCLERIDTNCIHNTRLYTGDFNYIISGFGVMES